MRRAAVLLLLSGTPAHAERYVVQPGETLEHVAASHHCSTDDVLRANQRDNVLVPAGTVVTIPTCGQSLAARAHTRTMTPPPPQDDAVEDDPESRARAALATIDGTPPPPPTPGAQSIGAPWDGQLRHASHLATATDDAYVLRRPQHAFGAAHAVAAIAAAIADVRAAHPHSPTLAIGDLSAEHGGKLAQHLSHQSGLDADIGFYFTRPPADYPAQFVTANADFDLPRNLALLTSLLPHAQLVFLDYAVQARLYKYAASLGTSHAELARIFQYPRGADTQAGIVRHWPHHDDHFHVRFAPR